MWGRVRVGGVRPHATLSRLLPTATHAVRSIARGAWAPARRVGAPLRCGVPQGPHHLVRWCGGVVRRGVSVGAEQARFCTPFASPTAGPAIRRLDGLVRRPRLCLWAPCAHPLARRPRVLVARQHAVSEPTSLTCGTWTGKRLPDRTLGPPHGARALVVHARARRVGRGGNERAHTARAIASRGRIGGGARCTPRGRGRRPRGRGRVTGARGSHNDKGAILGGFWDAWKAARKCDFFFCQTRLQSGDKFVISLRAHILRDVARTPSTGPACCGAHHFFGWCPTADVWRERVCVFGECFLNAFCELVF